MAALRKRFPEAAVPGTAIPRDKPLTPEQERLLEAFGWYEGYSLPAVPEEPAAAGKEPGV